MGVGGVSMRIIADFLIGKGYKVIGVDPFKKPDLDFYKFFDHHNSNPKELAVGIIIVSHFFSDNPEKYPDLLAGYNQNIPVILRIDFINYIAQAVKGHNRIISVLGTSGKTTTTYMGFSMAKFLGNNPSIFGGSFLPLVGNNYYLGTGDVFIENDESRDEHLRIESDVLIIPSLHPDHLEENCYNHSFDKLKQSFLQQINQSKMVIYYSDGGVLDQLIQQSNKTLGMDCFNYSDTNENAHCYLGNFTNDTMGSMGTLVIKKNNQVKSLSLGVPFNGIKNFLNFSAVIFLLVDQNNYKKIIEMARFMYLAAERGTYCGIIGQTVLVNTFAQIMAEFSANAVNYKTLYPHKKLYMAIEITRLDRYNREIIHINELFPYVEKIFMMSPWAVHSHVQENDPNLINPNYDPTKLDITYNLKDFYDKVFGFCQQNHEESILLCCGYVKPMGLWLIEQLNKDFGL
jgi:UDP-N-acetylmuramate--alanine ligase